MTELDLCSILLLFFSQLTQQLLHGFQLKNCLYGMTPANLLVSSAIQNCFSSHFLQVNVTLNP